MSIIWNDIKSSFKNGSSYTRLLYIYFAIPVKAKYFVMAIGALALFSGISNNPADNIAHFAHLGGMIFGFLLLKYWKKKGDIHF